MANDKVSAFYSKNTRQKAKYLAQLTCDAALELDAYEAGRPEGYAAGHELSDILLSAVNLTKKNAIITTHFPYMSLITSLKATTDKKMTKVPELGLEMTLLAYELRAPPRNPQTDYGLKRTLLELSQLLLGEALDFRSYVA
jgi:hypothetical protein